MSYVNASEACKYYNVCAETLRQWEIAGKIESKKTDGGHRRYKLPINPEGKSIIYARVSSKKQEQDLERQIAYIKRKYPDFEIVRDIGSGLNFKRQGFRNILEHLFKRNIKEVVVSSSDRFSRFGTKDFFAWLFEQFGGKLTILNNKLYEDPNEELSEDILEIITVFSARLHGRRKYKDSKKD
jgi:predicted site-specific integrase-resolvase